MTNQMPAQVSNFVRAAQANRQSAAFNGDKGFLKFSGKTGEWSYGRDETAVEGEIVIINILATQHGFVRWGENPPAKAMSPVTQPLPQAPEALRGVDPYTGGAKTYEPQAARKLEGRFLADDLGEFVFETNSMGGVERVDSLLDAVFERAASGTEYVFPKIVLARDFYKRPDGKVFKPMFEVQAWCDVNGAEEGAKATKAIKAAPVEEVVEEEEESLEETVAAPTAAPRRRRARA